MSAFNALTDGGLIMAPDPGPLPTQDGGSPMGTPQPAAATAADVGTPPYTGMHNTPLQVAFLGLVALGVIILLRRAGFRFSVAGKLAGGR